MHNNFLTLSFALDKNKIHYSIVTISIIDVINVS